jgi:hypothetical protein
VSNLHLQLDPHAKDFLSRLHLSFACILVIALNMLYTVHYLIKQLIELPTRFGAELGNE